MEDSHDNVMNPIQYKLIKFKLNPMWFNFFGNGMEDNHDNVMTNSKE